MRKEVKFICNLFEPEKPRDEQVGLLSRFRAFGRAIRHVQEKTGDMTEWLSKKINGDRVETEVAYEEMVWFVKAKADDVDFFVSVIGSHPIAENQRTEHQWTLSVHDPILGFFEKRDYHKPMEKLIRRIDAVLKSEPKIREIVWFTRTKKGDPIDEANVPI